ncbi:SDR family NAD(P)-dependent oxidoreductase [Microbacterium rhizomatis]|uniref:SDR family NAD(P)-dependent oxidoreductase n=1 Tax=Microbacterium rhizomatis TaxID=1631477 RepID=A0A5J5IWQ2_9MICO|nr:SDR family NAD(P)-dependent oxidoreductase [Microbacterium rhizomatis]KAA9105901.1 SDR family NAD(P)-dependent oxidoreductase [Microbacterium rhizomatis]
MGVRFEGQVVVITGSGAGLGRSYALEFASRGAAVVVNDPGSAVDGSDGEPAVADQVVELIRSLGGKAVASYESVVTEAGADAIVETAVNEFGRLDALVNNAGILRDRALHNMTTDEWQGVVDVHLGGAFHMTRAALKIMRPQGYGRVVYATSNAGLFGNFGQSNYAAAKAGLLGLSRVLAIEGERYGIASNVVAPVARTRMTEDVLGEFVQRLGPESVVPMVVFLASKECDRTGRVYSAAGGRYSEVITGLTTGWVASTAAPGPEDIAANLPSIEDNQGYLLPRSVFDELAQIKAALAL